MKFPVHRLLSAATAVLLMYGATGGDERTTAVLGTPLAVLFFSVGTQRAMVAMAVAFSLSTGILLALIPGASLYTIPAYTYYVMVAIISGLCARLLTRSREGEKSDENPFANRWTEGLTFIAAVVVVRLMLTWTTSTDLGFFNALQGSEDNAAWVSAATTIVSGESNPSFLTFSNSPVTSVLLGVAADAYRFSHPNLPDHLLGLRALRASYAILISLSVLSAMLWVTSSARRASAPRLLTLLSGIATVVIAYGTIAYIFVGFGFLSFINAIWLCLVIVIMFGVVPARNRQQNPLELALVLVLAAGLAGAWWGMVFFAPLPWLALMVNAVRLGNWSLTSRFGKRLVGTLGVLGALTILMVWYFTSGAEVNFAVLGFTGTVPLINTAWLPVTFLSVAFSLSRFGLNSDNESSKGRPLTLLSLTMYASAVWLFSVYRYAEPRYAANKIMTMVSIIAMIGLLVALVERWQSHGVSVLMIGIALVALQSQVVHESNLGMGGPALSERTDTNAALILQALERFPDKSVVCLHQKPELQIRAYLCSRFATAFNPGRSPALTQWTGAILDSDMSPNGRTLTREQHIGTTVLKLLEEEGLQKDLVVILIGGDGSVSGLVDLGPDFWWVQELDFNAIRTINE